jgi:hypothetical protein
MFICVVSLKENNRCTGISMKNRIKRSAKTVFEGPSSKKTRGKW